MTTTASLARLRRLVEGPGQRGVAPSVLSPQILAVCADLTDHDDPEVRALAARLSLAVRTAR